MTKIGRRGEGVSEFIIDPLLSSDSDMICELGLSRLLLSRNALFPWVILVPRRDNLREIIDLPEEDRGVLMREISLVSRVMKDIFKPDKLNVAALGNVVSQLHVHIIARYVGDAAWPGVPFGGESAEYEEERRAELIRQIREAVGEYDE